MRKSTKARFELLQRIKNNESFRNHESYQNLPDRCASGKGIDLSVEQGDFYALLGHNGAGKSTTIGIISSLVNKPAVA
ncbi:ABC transporter ATP-binding protein [Actinobacillus equuli]|nr:ABC transporter ATP-binding protein [Actinobacillus equuli]